jgi:TATA-box binding protein (TBP) (component of TFIID and TFIIIB)
MKFNSLIQEDLDIIKKNLKNESYYEEHIITSINNPTGRIKFKDIRKISVGISKKDIMSYRCKQKSAFYNCFVMIMRLKINNIFKEFHIKVFNTGKMEIPGVQNDENFQEVLNTILSTMQPFVKEPLSYNQKCDTVLINSNFNCGFFINREILFDLLKFKYNIQCIYDPCSYPGIQCKFYYNPDVGLQNGCQISEENKQLYKNVKEVSFMIFRTGSVLIVGRCDENVLMIIYEFLKIILRNEFKNICQKNIKIADNGETAVKDKKKKLRRKNITIEIQPEILKIS